MSFYVKGVKCAAWLYLPSGSVDTSVPAVVLAHGLGGVRTWRLDDFAQALRQAGYACLVFDYRGFGDSEGTPRQIVDPELLLEDWRAAVLYARARPEIDPDRVVLFGTSFSGGHVTRLGAEDHRLAAIIAQCPFLDGIASTRAIDPLRALRLTAAALQDVAAEKFGAPRVLVDLGGGPGSKAMVLADEADFAALIPEGVNSETRLAARAALKIMGYRPGTSTPRVSCPILFILCENDRLIPVKSSLRYAARAPFGEIQTVPYGHFDIYSGAPFGDVIARELEFLARTVPTAATAPIEGQQR
ncbi:alpha/beta hydrolase [Nocardia nova]|uniref:alpha/beta hydrolase n=1 Tax=Nocardia nova TaxID=37330 RepID=UPI0034035BB0